MENYFILSEIPELLIALVFSIFFIYSFILIVFQYRINISEYLNAGINKYNIVPAISMFLCYLSFLNLLIQVNLINILVYIVLSVILLVSFVKGVERKRKDEERKRKQEKKAKEMIKKFEEAFVGLQKISMENPFNSYHFFD
ncbi:MAG: hypothetical protein WCX15_02150 [Bacilli bacterium]|jgi:nicotinamide riboside transporter PnuC